LFLPALYVAWFRIKAPERAPTGALLRHADCIRQSPGRARSGKHMLVLSSSQFDP
jgi:hypothetical protein